MDNDNANKNLIKLAINIVIIVIYATIIPIGERVYNNHTIKFKDENMEKLMTEYFQKSEITPEDMAELYELDLGYIGYYDTLEDLKWLKNVEKLVINSKPTEEEDELVYRVFKGEVPEEVSSEQVEQYEKELGKVLPKLKNLKKIWITGDYGCEWKSIDFLKRCEQIEEISFTRFKATDYSVLKKCKSLRRISLLGSNVTSARDLIRIEKLENLSVRNTPLAENPEEVKKLEMAYPNAEIKY